MSNFQQKPGFGSLFRNKKEKDTQPDYRGDACTPKGEQIEIAGWLKQDKNGKTFMSLKVQEPREQRQQEAPQQRQQQAPQRAARALYDEDAPF
jgi:uncharacterized protein (DUF736 family)